MSHTYELAAPHTTNDAGALMQEHPRGRGFSILSRLARGHEEPVATGTPHAESVERTAQVLPFDRPNATPVPRHRRDDADVESARRSS
jgi:hypothetical protein